MTSPQRSKILVWRGAVAIAAVIVNSWNEGWKEGGHDAAKRTGCTRPGNTRSFAMAASSFSLSRYVGCCLICAERTGVRTGTAIEEVGEDDKMIVLSGRRFS